MASEGDKVTRGPGRPRTVLSEDPLEVNIERFSSCGLSLQIPNRLMFMWYKENTIRTTNYLPLINGAVYNQVIQLKQKEELAQKVCQRAGSVFRYASRKKAGRARMEFLKENSIISISHENMVSLSKVQEENMEIKEFVVELQSEIIDAREELALCQNEVKNMSAQLKKVVSERDEMVNKGSSYDSIGAKQKKRKLVQFKRAADAALWFSESFGLVPTELTACTSTSDETITIPLGNTPTPSPVLQPTRQVDEFAAMQTLYLLDRFGVSDEFYHELTQVC